MKTFECSCGNTIFFENTQCVSCGRALGWCPVCKSMSTLTNAEKGVWTCGNRACGAKLFLCHNYAKEKVCNRCYVATEDAVPSKDLCDYCRFNDTIPDLTVPGNREMWLRLEEAKRRLFYTLDLIGLPYGSRKDKFDPPLAFDFKADSINKKQWWWSMGREERVFTGHAGGKITINLREADPVEREKTRVMFQEAHRTVIGHFRHEIGHYYWEMLVKRADTSEFESVFGNFEDPSYSVAQEAYYQNGPKAGWQSNFISGYASMHPWEDFAETFGAYLDMVSVLDTALHMGICESCNPLQADLEKMVEHYIKLGVRINEMNRAMGLIDFVPDILVPPVVGKLKFVHTLVQFVKTESAEA